MRTAAERNAPGIAQVEAVPQIELHVELGVRIELVVAGRAPDPDEGVPGDGVQVRLSGRIAVAGGHPAVDVVAGDGETASHGPVAPESLRVGRSRAGGNEQ